MKNCEACGSCSDFRLVCAHTAGGVSGPPLTRVAFFVRLNASLEPGERELPLDVRFDDVVTDVGRNFDRATVRAFTPLHCTELHSIPLSSPLCVHLLGPVPLTARDVLLTCPVSCFLSAELMAEVMAAALALPFNSARDVLVGL